MSSITRQPTQLDYASPTQFKFGIAQLPKVEFFTTAANLPGITMVDSIFPTPFKDIPVIYRRLKWDVGLVQPNAFEIDFRIYKLKFLKSFIIFYKIYKIL